METEDKHYREHIEGLKIIVPGELEESTMTFIEHKESVKKKFITRISSAAALILILVSAIIFVPAESQEMDYADKYCALVEANKLFAADEPDTDAEEVIYEDESIIIYIK
jgi:hypothetical protein